MYKSKLVVVEEHTHELKSVSLGRSALGTSRKPLG